VDGVKNVCGLMLEACKSLRCSFRRYKLRRPLDVHLDIGIIVQGLGLNG
jgi:hypothetical protein